MANGQLHPLEVNPQTGEPFLRLPSPHKHIILTPPRMSDVDAIVPIMNDPRVHPWMGQREHPFLREHCQSWVAEFKATSDSVIRELEEEEGGEIKIVDNSPLRSLREVKEDGTEEYLGDIGIKRCTWAEVIDDDEKKILIEENAARMSGDPDIVWQVADFLTPTHHRQGIMSAALGNLLQHWAIPRMRVRHIRLAVFKGNVGSLKMLQKNGFVLIDDVEAVIELRGEKRSLQILEWRGEKVEAQSAQ